MGKHRKINVGDKFGRLKVLEPVGTGIYGNKPTKMYRCACDCGNIVTLPGKCIGRDINSCGCLQRESREKEIPPGTLFGRLKVISKSTLVPGRGYKYLCRCECEKLVEVRGDRLRSWEVQSCGCLHNELLAAHREENYKKMFVGGTNVPKIMHREPQKNNSTGVRGVSYHKVVGKYQARISFAGTLYHLGYFSNVEDARLARESAEKRLHNDFLEWYAKNYPAAYQKMRSKQNEN